MPKIFQGFSFQDTEELRRLLTEMTNPTTDDPIMLVPFVLPHLLRFGFDEAEDADYLTILEIDSDLREFPLSEDFRARCHPDFLQRKDRELIEFKKLSLEDALSAGKSVLAKIEREFNSSG